MILELQYTPIYCPPPPTHTPLQPSVIKGLRHVKQRRQFFQAPNKGLWRGRPPAFLTPLPYLCCRIYCSHMRPKVWGSFFYPASIHRTETLPQEQQNVYLSPITPLQLPVRRRFLVKRGKLRPGG